MYVGVCVCVWGLGEVTQEERGGKYGKMSCGFFYLLSFRDTEMSNFLREKNKENN